MNIHTYAVCVYVGTKHHLKNNNPAYLSNVPESCSIYLTCSLFFL